jgi:hypothetical protein
VNHATIRLALLALVFGLLSPALVAAQQQTPAPAPAAPAADQIRDEISRLRQELDSLRDDYQKRMQDLEARLAALESGPVPAGTSPGGPPEPPPAAAPPPQPTTTQPAETAPTAPAAQPTAQVPSGAAGSGGPEGALPVYSNAAASSKIFNPDMAVIGNFIGASGTNEIENRPALSLNEAEFSFQAIVDPYARADFFVTMSPEEVGVEEGFLTLTALPGGFLARVGKMKAQFGKTNTQHPHQLPWVDQPLVLNDILGSDEGLNDSGVSVSKLLLNPWFFLEATGEVYQGENATFSSYTRSDLAYVGRLRGYRDISEATNLDVGTSFATGRNSLGPDSRSRLFGVDATLRYRPLRRAIYRRLLARTEFMWSRTESGIESDPTHSAFGMYAGGEYQLSRRWFAGARYDYSERALDASLKDKAGSLLFTFWPSEFSQVRGQFRRTRYAEGQTANELLFQFMFAIGAHGAHVF